MTSFTTSIDSLDWAGISAQLSVEGYAVLPGLLDEGVMRGLVRHIPNMETANRELFPPVDLGCGERFYFGASLPAPLDALRAAFYRRLTVIANRWHEVLGTGSRYPAELEDFFRLNRKAGQVQAQSYLNRLGVGDDVPLHQRGDGEQVFPMQIVALLSEPSTDFAGGEFVMTEQRPRMQSRPMVLPLRLGDAAIISTAERPFKGAKGHYRANMKHAISRVRRGERIGMELSFHDARACAGHPAASPR